MTCTLYNMEKERRRRRLPPSRVQRQLEKRISIQASLDEMARQVRWLGDRVSDHEQDINQIKRHYDKILAWLKSKFAD